MRVLLIKGDVAAAEGLSLFLEGAGFKVDHTEHGREAIEMVRHHDYDLVLLNVDLPDIDGCEVVRRLRAAKMTVPVILLSAICRSDIKVRAFAAGIDDFVTLPFDQAELVARMRAVLRRSNGYSEQILRVGRLELHLDSREVYYGGKGVRVTNKEYEVLQLLVLRKGTVLHKEAFLSHLYGGSEEPGVKIIDVFMCKLRKKLQLAGAGNMITTSWGRGYVLHADAAMIPPVAASDNLRLPSAA